MRLAADANAHRRDMGARRLHALLETLPDDPLFDAPDRLRGRVIVGRAFVERKLARVVAGADLGEYVL